MAAPQPSWQSHLRWLLGTLAATILAVGGFNLLIDPLNVFGAPRIAGLNSIKPHLDHHRELTRWRAALRHCPDTVIFGNSRAEIGFDPDGEPFARRGLNAVNMAVPGVDANTAYRQLLWLKSAGCMPKEMILGVEFFDFLGGTAARALPRIETDPPPRRDANLLAELVFSLQGLGDSIGTVALQGARYPATLTDRGFNPLLNYVAEVEHNGHYALFRQRAVENARSWSRKPRRLWPEQPGAVSEDAQAVEAILTAAAQAGATVHVVIYPYHGQLRLMMERMGLGKLFAEWKLSLVTMAARAAAGKGRIEVWDFSGLSAQTLEPVPERSDRRTRLAYYWEAGHFKKALGDIVLARLLGSGPGPGLRLDTGNVQAWVDEDRRAVQALLAAPSPLRDEVDDVLRRTLGHGAGRAAALGFVR